jgi:nitroreductase
MTIEELEKMIKTRRSIRQWKKGEVPDPLLMKAVELATWAPNGGNYQGWHFVVVKNSSVILAMANAVQSAVDKIASWSEGTPWREDVRRSQQNAPFFKHASACVAVFISQYTSAFDKVLLAREPIDEEAKRILGCRRFAPTSIQSAGAAVATMLLAFHQMGLGAVWLGAPLVAKKEIESILKVPPTLDLVCLVAVGYPAESPEKGRRPIEEVVEFIY